VRHLVISHGPRVFWNRQKKMRAFARILQSDRLMA
jgi:hypothetical protein